MKNYVILFQTEFDQNINCFFEFSTRIKLHPKSLFQVHTISKNGDSNLHERNFLNAIRQKLLFHNLVSSIEISAKNSTPRETITSLSNQARKFLEARKTKLIVLFYFHFVPSDITDQNTSLNCHLHYFFPCFVLHFSSLAPYRTIN